MNAWVIGFFMAWGMFLAIPCPVRKWDENSRSQMMVCLPLVGGVVGGLWALLAWLLRDCTAPAGAFLLAVLPWICTGFLHLDGYMDVCDAVLSRRDLATRQKILKDSHCGAFAVICMALLALGQWSVFLSADTIPLLPLALVPMATRACASLAVSLLRPLGTSQYAAMRKVKPWVVVLLAGILLAVVVLPLWRLGRFGGGPLAAAAGYALAAAWGYRQLDGISGDISGFALTLGELAGAAAVCLVR